ncbi:MAG: putative toxin-antitoxin system toxin component, PIN family [Nitrospirota bacterium]
MRYKVFLDTNILLSGIFFEGNESKILDLIEIEFVTSEDVVDELFEVVKKKLKHLKERNLEIALAETDRALSDIVVVQRSKYAKKVHEAESLISHKKDVPILAAVLSVKPDYFLTGDSHFFTDKIKDAVTVMTAREFLDKIKMK